MLAQNFKTAADLDISDAEQNALTKVLGMLERNEVVRVDNYISPTIPNGFNMQRVKSRSECGTVACIKGWCQLLGSDELFDMFKKPYQMEVLQLFMYGDERRGAVTVDQAATALRSYLTTGDANWAEALSVTSQEGQKP